MACMSHAEGEPVKEYTDAKGRHVVVVRKRRKRSRIKRPVFWVGVAIALLAILLTVFLLVRISGSEDRHALNMSRKVKNLQARERAERR